MKRRLIPVLRRSPSGTTKHLKASLYFTVVFYGLRNFRCKSTHFCATRRGSETTVTPSVSNAAQADENARKKSFLNYKSAAPVRLNYDANVIYVILGDVLTFILPPVVHRSPLECPFTYEKSAMAEGVGFVRCAALRPPVVRRRRSRMQSDTRSARPKL